MELRRKKIYRCSLNTSRLKKKNLIFERNKNSERRWSPHYEQKI